MHFEGLVVRGYAIVGQTLVVPSVALGNALDDDGLAFVQPISVSGPDYLRLRLPALRLASQHQLVSDFQLKFYTN